MKKLALALVFLGWSFVSLKAQTLKNTSNNKTEIQYLSGIDKDHMVDWDFFCSEGNNSGKWTKIGVPSCWELQGFGGYNYGHDGRDKTKKIHKEYGLYKRSFFAPLQWKNNEVKIVFEGVMTDAEVKINGKLAGEIHQGAFYEFKYTISELLKYGKENLLEVKVNKVSSNTSINFAERDADFWIFGGIYRPVYLEIVPKDFMERIAVNAKADGTIEMDVFSASKKATGVQLFLSDLKGNKIQDLPLDSMNFKNGKWSIATKAKNVKTWNPEKPNLYLLNVALVDKSKKVLHSLTERIGFRTVEIKAGDGIYVNGQRIKFKGVNRHSFYPSSGRTTSKALSIAHVKMMKDMNMNAVRMSHYPPDVHFLEVCDSLGLFVIDEVCTWHSPHLDTKVGEKIVKETVVRDVNHPSILLWANGNETGWNTELDDDYAIWDIQKREVLHPWNIFNKTNTMHYPSYHVFAYDGYAKDKIYFPTEFLHGLYDGGHGAGLEDYWKQMWNMPLSAGGFLWDFADEAVVRTDKNGFLDADGNHAADGIVGPYGEKEASYFTIKQIWSPIYLEDRFIKNDFNGVFRVENRYHFTNLEECKITAKWVQFEGPKGSSKLNVLAQSNVALPSLKPGEKGTFTVALPTNWQTADALYLTAIDATGMEIFTWSYPVKTPQQLNTRIIAKSNNGAIKMVKDNGQIIVEAAGIRYVFSDKTSLLQEVKKEGKLIPFHNGPIILGHKDKIISLTTNTQKDKIEILTVFELKDKSPDWASHKELSSDQIKWTIHSNGLLDLEVQIKGKKQVTDYKGITFSFPESEVSGMKWLGDGPYRVWRNRMKGTQFKVWENDYNNTVTGESGFVYPEFKGFFSSLYWATVKGKNNNGFTIYCHSPHTFLRMLTPQNPTPKEDPKGRLSPKFPQGDISFVKNIPAIGTKFQEGDKMGPQGNSENYFGNDDEPIVLHLTFEF
ncbi:glycoside hydrolase family 2 TIM barrel-domain containing protein [Flavobacterium sp. NG2]|uniref:glycoside hydrolase family 2 protein n=1 Tax=Flavobacterium sp. NG2 TaxID=3097547 RepID=UPI002A815692|nr:glycoside hydrolase family 2 TIM barrel-domain containing protein [Flavobacterium sp. NG2]WPR71142.1 glycoside hydrolase family 2 TIM barrel-domain containing protein [Flavobacterium sp. NG2]